MNEQNLNEQNNKEQSIKVQHFLQSAGLCGPASLKILLSYFGKLYSEEKLAQLAQATLDNGTEHNGLVAAIKSTGGYCFAKEEGTLDELEYFVKKEKLPVIIGWFDSDEDHYSVVVNITEKNIIIVDPATNEPERWLDREKFNKIWFDFVGRENKIVSWGWYMVVSFEKREFSVKDGFYF
ncbi:hypothetical protein A3D55_01265 [Candidatus Jorgensenbacteria bacterium RIFCSPHIGHO2_02_FULL_45_20]|uniref:Peptidase C39 domain-containing protein n=2 Tax=Candidatus Joergenseniibacteriota TaxID=1752739 RepID=A0A1F6BN31_9BACT|nr:MAG: hypothetical protein UX22_C0012G0006 [Candidatus Jorgensenbacteria bacterium GW2011_GWA2_45_9]OGG38329.1 MAG: hypothetical protein A3D55_01265 [Candidatus Jorgensenbacteria bacterium RIFCSPHIGHO2_02_FULL_45_20]